MQYTTSPITHSKNPRLICLIYVIIVSAVMVSGCASTPPSTPPTASIGPYTDFSGRLIVIEPRRRWQVSIDWKGNQEQGQSRLTHAASGRIVELQWSGDRMQTRDNYSTNHSTSSIWRAISTEQLSQHGIILSPQILAQILNGDMPAIFKAKDAQTWQGMFNGNSIRIHWSAAAQKLTMTDIKHGRKVTLIINDANHP